MTLDVSDRAVVIFEIEGDILHLDSGLPKNPALQALIDEFTTDGGSTPDTACDPPVTATLIATEDGVVYELLLNSIGVGYFALKTILDTLDLDLRLPKVDLMGEISDEVLDRYLDECDYECYVLPLFGDSDETA